MTSLPGPGERDQPTDPSRLSSFGQDHARSQRRASMADLARGHRVQALQDADSDEGGVSPRTLRRNRASTRRCPALHQAAWECDLALLETLLSSGEDPDTGDSWNLTPIMSTLMRHSLQDTRCVFRGRDTVLRNLVMDCREEDAERVAKSSAVLKLLFHYGASPDARSNAGKTALHYATCDGLYAAAELLLDAGATLDAQDKTGQTPLRCAVEERSLLVANLFLSRGACIDVQDDEGESPLSLAIRKDMVDVMQLFMNHHQLVATRERPDFAGDVLLQAVEAEAVEIVKFVLESGYACVNYQNTAGETAMHRAILKGSATVLKDLCALDSSGLSLHAVTSDGESCIHLAARIASAETLEILLALWRQVKDESTRGLLNEAAADKSTALVVAGTTTNCRDECDLFVDRQEKMRVLLSHGATLLGNAAPSRGCTQRETSGVVLPAQAQRCLVQWLTECRMEGHGEYLHDLTRKWIANVPAEVDSDTAQDLSALLVIACAGYAVDILPLLLMLPQQRTSMPIFIEGLKSFTSGPNSLQFRCLIDELGAAWA